MLAYITIHWLAHHLSEISLNCAIKGTLKLALIVKITWLFKLSFVEVYCLCFKQFAKI